MNHLWALLYGIIQGLTEFLPVSSSGHLALLPFFGHIKDPGLFFDLAMHVGTALAVFVYFRRDVFKILRNLLGAFNPKTADHYFSRYFCVATIITGVLAILLKSSAELYGRNYIFISINLSIFGFLLYFVDKKYPQDKRVFDNAKGLMASVVIGVSQAFAIFPGVSRSGITISAARLYGIDKESASRFSFLLSLPLIFAGALLKGLEISKVGESFDVLFCLEGMIVSFIVGLLTIHYFLKLLKKIKFVYFMYYRFLLAAVVLFLYFNGY